MIHLSLYPAEPDNGITFVRTDRPGAREITARHDQVWDTTLATTLGYRDLDTQEVISVSTVEHLLAALVGLGIDNVRICVDGPEIPIFDGSAAPIVALLQQAGREQQRRLRKRLVVRKEVKVTEGNKSASIVPCHLFKLTCGLDYEHPLIDGRPYSYSHSPQAFLKELAPARTFGFLQDVEALRSRGLALGGSLDNAIVIDGYKVLNTDGLRFANEFVRHKLLDALGDLALLGYPLVGHVQLHCTGHHLNAKLVQALLAQPSHYVLETPTLPQQVGQSLTTNPFAVMDSSEGMAPCS